MTQVPISAPRRVRELRDEREPKPDGLLPWDQGRLFARLLVDERGGSGYGASHTSIKACTEATRIEALTEHLVPLIAGTTQWPLIAVLHLPRLGRINARVSRERDGWNIELEAEQETTARWLSSVQPQCQVRLAACLKGPVHLARSA